MTTKIYFENVQKAVQNIGGGACAPSSLPSSYTYKILVTRKSQVIAFKQHGLPWASANTAASYINFNIPRASCFFVFLHAWSVGAKKYFVKCYKQSHQYYAAVYYISSSIGYLLYQTRAGRSVPKAQECPLERGKDTNPSEPASSFEGLDLQSFSSILQQFRHTS